MRKANRYSVEEKLNILREAANAGSIQGTCAKYQVSRDSFYRWQRAYSEQGLVGLQNKVAMPSGIAECT